MVRTARDMLSGELERLFSSSNLMDLCTDYLGIDPVDKGLYDDSKAVFARRVVEWSDKSEALEALADTLVTLKKDMVDPRVKQMLEPKASTNGITVGTKVSGFMVGEKVKVGGLGTVYKCAKENTSGDADPVQDYGINIIHGEHVIDRHAAERFKTFMRFLKIAKPSNILPIESVGELEDGRPFVIYSWVEGTLLCKVAPLAPRRAIEIVEAVREALFNIHEMGSVHGDLNSENILLLSEGETIETSKAIMLLGFGVDRLFFRSGPATNGSGFYGHFNGMTPEQARGRKPDIRSDIYGLGALLYELVHGEPPFKGAAPIDVIAAHLASPVPSLALIHDDPTLKAIDNVVLAMMAKEPRLRPQNLCDVKNLLEEANRCLEELIAQSTLTGTRDDIELSAEALLESPEDEEVLDALKTEARDTNSWLPAMEVMEEAAAKTEDESTARKLLLEAARVAAKHVKDYDKALGIYNTLAKLDPGDRQIKDKQLELLRTQGKYKELIEGMALQAETTEVDEEKLFFIREIAKVYEENLQDFSKAFDYHLACVDFSGCNDEVMDKLEQLANQSGRLEDLAAACVSAAQEAENTSNVETAIYYYKRSGNHYSSRLNEPAYALTCFQKVLELEPKDTDALEATANLYRDAKQWEETADALTILGAAERAPSVSRDYLAEAARILFEQLDDKDGASKLLESVVSSDPSHKKAVNLLVDIYDEKEEWTKLTKVLKSSISAAPEGEDLVRMRYRLGELYEDRLDDLKAAEEQYEEGVRADNSNMECIKGLERVYARRGDMKTLKDNLELQLSLATTPKQEMHLHERLADICEEEFKDYNQAIEHFKVVSDLDPHYRGAHIALSRLYRLTEKWEDLVDVLARRARTDGVDIEERKNLFIERATVIREKLGDARRAAEAFGEVAASGAEGTMETLAKTQEEAGDFDAAIITFRKMVDQTEDVGAKIECMVRIADIQIEELHRPEDAVATLRRVLDITPQNAEVLGKLKRVLVAQGNYAAALETLEKKQELTEGVSARAELFAEKGVICLDNIGDQDRALSYFEQAIQLDENNFTAGDRLSEIYRTRDQWEKALPIYERWADAADALTKEKQVELFTQLGEAYDRLESRNKALETFKKAVSIVGEESHLIKRLGEVALALEGYALAREQFAKYLSMMGEELQVDAKVEILVNLGKACLGVGEYAEAAKYARQGTSFAPDHIGARLLLASVHEERGDFRGVVEACQHVLACSDIQNEDRIPLLRRAATVLFEKLKDGDGAIKMLTEASEIDPNDRAVLGDLLRVYTTLKKYNEIIDVILRIAFLVDDPVQVSRYYFTVGKIYRREIKRMDKAIEYFEMVLENDPSFKEAESSIVEILRETKDWEKLESFYKRRIARMPKDASSEEKLEVYKPLADVLISKLNRRQDGILITEALTKLEPDSIVWLDKLTELYGWEVEYAKKNVALQRKLLAINPARVDAFRMLYRIFSAQNNPDKAWCAASLLALLNQASPEERVYYKEYQPDDLPTLTNRAHTEQWSKYLFHWEMDQTITGIFSLISEAIINMKAEDYGRFDLNPESGKDVASDTSQAAGFINFAAGSLGVVPPKLFLRNGNYMGIELLATRPPSLLAQSGTAGFKDRMGTAFSLGQQLTLLRPGLIVRRLVESGTELSAWLLAAIKCFVPTLPVPGDVEGLVSERMAHIHAMDTDKMERLQTIVRSFVVQTNDVDLKRWSRSVDYTMDRAGLILCGDVSVAVRVLKSQIKDQAVLSDRLRALTLFVVSDEHFTLREHLGSALVSA